MIKWPPQVVLVASVSVRVLHAPRELARPKTKSENWLTLDLPRQERPADDWRAFIYVATIISIGTAGFEPATP